MFKSEAVTDVLTSLFHERSHARAVYDNGGEEDGADTGSARLGNSAVSASFVGSEILYVSVQPSADECPAVLASGLYSMHSVAGNAQPVWTSEFHNYKITFGEKYRVWQLVDSAGHVTAESAPAPEAVRAPCDMEWRFSGRHAGVTVAVRREAKSASAASLQFSQQLQAFQKKYQLRYQSPIDRAVMMEMANRIRNLFGSSTDPEKRRERFRAQRLQIAGHRVGKFLALVRKLQRNYRLYVDARDEQFRTVLAAWKADDAQRKAKFQAGLRKMVSVQSSRKSEFNRRVSAINSITDMQRKAAVMYVYRQFIVDTVKRMKIRPEMIRRSLPMDTPEAQAQTLNDLRAALTKLQQKWHDERAATIMRVTTVPSPPLHGSAGGVDAGGAQVEERAPKPDPRIAQAALLDEDDDWTLLLLHWQPSQEGVIARTQSIHRTLSRCASINAASFHRASATPPRRVLDGGPTPTTPSLDGRRGSPRPVPSLTLDRCGSASIADLERKDSARSQRERSVMISGVPVVEECEDLATCSGESAASSHLVDATSSASPGMINARSPPDVDATRLGVRSSVSRSHGSNTSLVSSEGESQGPTLVGSPSDPLPTIQGHPSVSPTLHPTPPRTTRVAIVAPLKYDVTAPERGESGGKEPESPLLGGLGRAQMLGSKRMSWNPSGQRVRGSIAHSHAQSRISHAPSPPSRDLGVAPMSTPVSPLVPPNREMKNRRRSESCTKAERTARWATIQPMLDKPGPSVTYPKTPALSGDKASTMTSPFLAAAAKVEQQEQQQQHHQPSPPPLPPPHQSPTLPSLTKRHVVGVDR